MPKQRNSVALPKLRFPQFSGSGPWSRVRLSELLVESKIRNRELKYERADVISVSGEHGCVNQISLLGRSYAGLSVKDYHVVETGNLVYTKSPLKRNPFGIIKENKGAAGIVSTLYAVYRANRQAHAAYFDHYFASDYRVNSYLQPIVRKGAKNDMKVNNFAVLGGDVVVPDLSEQRRIAECLTSLNAVITAQARKVDALKVYKRGLMQRLFPREGETVPRLRFPEFRDAPEWAHVKLGRYVDIHGGYSPSNFILSPRGVYPYVKVEDLNNCQKYQFTAREFCADELGTIPSQSILFPKRGAAIELNKIRISASAIQIDTNLMALTPRLGLIPEFLFYYLSNVGLAQIADTSTIPQINNKHIAPFSIHLPSGGEQVVIATSLATIDDRLATEYGKLDALKTHKSYLMQQLFPGPDTIGV